MFRVAFTFFLIVTTNLYAEDLSSKEFQGKLSEMLSRVEQSIQITRNQISENQSAPFLADLYMQLGELLSKKANALYYIKMEKGGNTDTKISSGNKQFSPITEVQKESIEVFKKILSEFPTYEKREKILYLLALGHKSIGENIKFIVTAEELFKSYPGSRQTVRARLLLGQFYFEDNKLDKAMAQFLPVTKSEFPYERNLSKYRLGLIYFRKDNFKKALLAFEDVIKDTELKDEDNEQSVSLNMKTVKSNLKREALTDSIRAFTRVFKKNPQPLKYYSRIAPTELLFQEVIEKLAYRYIDLKKFKQAVELLRAVSERISDPQRVVNIYQEVLLMIPIEERIAIPVAETRYVLERYMQWLSYYKIPKKTRAQAFNFFEKQTRDLGIRSHDIAKALRSNTETKKKKKSGKRSLASLPPKERKEKISFYLDRAEAYYRLYLGAFNRSKAAVKIVVNLADVLFLKENYVHSGEYYLRAFLGEFGKPTKQLKEQLIQNAILCGQKQRPYTYFEQLRNRGNLLASLKLYMRFDPSKKKDPKINFTYQKARLEQGMYEQAISGLYRFMGRFPASNYAADAGEIILDYYNSRNDFAGLRQWAKRMKAKPIKNKPFMRKVASISEQAELKLLEERAKKTSAYDAFNQGKGYLAVALASKSTSLKNTALKQALARSRAEQDIDTFIRTADVMAKREKDKKKQREIEESIVQEYIKVGRYTSALSYLDGVINSKRHSQKYRIDSLNEATNLALALRHFKALERYSAHPLWELTPRETREQVQQQVVLWLDSATRLPKGLRTRVLSEKWDHGILLSLYKARGKIGGNLKRQMLRRVRSVCAKSGRPTVCQWKRLEKLDKAGRSYQRSLASSPVNLPAIEKRGALFAQRLEQYQGLENSGDGQLDIVISLRIKDLFLDLSKFLKKAARANKELAEPLNAKAGESINNAKAYADRCLSVIKQTRLISPTNKFCTGPAPKSLQKMLDWKEVGTASVSEDSNNSDIIKLQKRLFAQKEGGDSLLELAQAYHHNKAYGHATAAASYGLSLYPGQKREFQTVLGCSLTQIGLLSEARYHLDSAHELDGMKDECLSALKRYQKRI